MASGLKASRRDILVAGSALAVAAVQPGAAARAGSLPSAPPPAGDQAPRTGEVGRIRLDTDWRFALGHADDPARDFGFGRIGATLHQTYAKQGRNAAECAAAKFDDSAWEAVNLPHDWAVALPFVGNPDAAQIKPDAHGMRWDPPADRGYKPLGREYPATSIGWYRRLITLTPQQRGGRVRIDFDGLFRSAKVIFNGYFVHDHEGGYTPFSVDVTDFLNTDGSPDVLVVRVDASLAEGWFYEGAGIYRHVWLSCHEPVHVPRDGVWVRASVDGKVDVVTTLRNDGGEAAQVRLASAVASTGAGALSEITIAPWSEVEVAQTLAIAAPRLWSVEQPTLYELETRLDGRPSAITHFGFRSIRFDAEQGFFLNGKRVELKGTCNHQDHAGVGVGVPDALWYYRLRLLKAMGSNAYRPAHNPPAPELLDACDELGIVVIDEARLMTSSRLGQEQLETMLRRDRNHPSVILWSIGNEEPQQGTERGARIAASMKRTVRRLDPTRPVTAAMNGGYGQGITGVIDVIGFNYSDDQIDGFHGKFPAIPIVATETASTVATRGEYARDEARHVVPAYDTDAPHWAQTAEQWWPHFDRQRFIAGGFIWTGFDYRGEPTPFSSWPSISSQFGVFDTCGFPKDNYWYYRAWWRPEPLVHLLPHWNWTDGETIKVWAHSNCDEVELFLNGRSLGRKGVERNRHAEWEVAFAPGRIEAKGYRAGKLAARDMRETASAPERIVLTADRADLAADGRDCAVLRAEVVDAHGRSVLRAGNLVRFAVTGPGAVIGVGNGDPNCHEPDKASARSAFNGLCSAIVQTGTAPGAITVTATADGLAAGQVRLAAR